MIWFRGRRHEKQAPPQEPDLARYERGLAEMRVDGELRAHVATAVFSMLWGAPWLWYVVVWADGRREFKEEDYGPLWPVVEEFDRGIFTYQASPTVWRQRRIWGFRFEEGVPGPGGEIDYELTWLGPEAAAEGWEKLGVTLADLG